MKSYQDFRGQAGFASESRAHSGFMSDMRGRVADAHAELVATCVVSTDPKVTAAHMRWKSLQELLTFIETPRKESNGE